MHPFRTSVALGLAVVAVTGGCRGDSGRTLEDTQPAASSGKVTTSAVPSSSTSVGGAGAGSPTTAPGRNVGGPPASVAAVPFPAPGVGAYFYHERVQPESGAPTERAVRFELSTVKSRTGSVIRWDEVVPESSAAKPEGDHYDQVHDREGLHLVNSFVLGKDECRWSPRSALLPRAVIVGGETETRSTCTVAIMGRPTELSLVTTLKFLRTHDYEVAGALRPSIDVSRVRVLTDNTNGTTVTSQAVDTYAFDLRVRVRTEEHTTSTSSGRSRQNIRVLTLTGHP